MGVRKIKHQLLEIRTILKINSCLKLMDFGAKRKQINKSLDPFGEKIKQGPNQINDLKWRFYDKNEENLELNQPYNPECHRLESTSSANLENMIDEVINNKKAASKFKNNSKTNGRLGENSKFDVNESLSDIFKKSVEVQNNIDDSFGKNNCK